MHTILPAMRKKRPAKCEWKESDLSNGDWKMRTIDPMTSMQRK